MSFHCHLFNLISVCYLFVLSYGAVVINVYLNVTDSIAAIVVVIVVVPGSGGGGGQFQYIEKMKNLLIY